MANALAVCLLAFFCLVGLSSARQVPKECSKGPEVWCQSLKIASECGAVGHCTATVWQTEETKVTRNIVSDKIIQLFRQLKDVKELINEEYLAARVSTACRDVPSPAVTTICKANTAHLEQYLISVLKSDTTPEAMCRIIGMCNNMKLDTLVANKKTEEPKQKPHLLGGSRCTWGPSYWCSNISTSHECGAIRHCVQRVWPKLKFPQDNDIICQICTDMVTQARDQLQSNETQEELKEVFEGSCKLIPIKIVQKECIKLSDDFVPELVETLASQMNPQAVCSVAGLCNNAKIDIMLEGYTAAYIKRTGCSQCLSTVHVARKKFDATSYDDFLIALLRMCGNMDSLSDSCSMLVFKYYENILEAVKKDLTPRSVCHVSGQCSETFFHSHSQYNFADENMTLYTVYDNDVPCEFCEQLVKHLRDTLIANTTEIEFQKILIGLCKQTGSFKSECLSLVEQYNAVIYNYLVSEMKPDELCGYIGICKKLPSVPIAPLVQDKKLGSRNYLIGAGVPGESKQLPKVTEVMSTERTTVQNVQIVGTEPQQLPVERMFIAAPTSPASPAVCSFCQYFLHYLQVELSDERTEEAIRKTVENACDVLPASINDECRQFVTQYGPAVIALLVQEIDPSSVCPALGLCPQVGEVRHVAINSEKSNCPLCLFAVEQLETMLKNNRSEEYLAARVSTACRDVPSPAVTTICKANTAHLEQYLISVLKSDTTPEAMCRIIGMCNNMKLDTLVANKKTEEPKQKPHLLGGSRCTWGPSYWCSNISTSHECGAIRHCVQRVWPKLKFPQDNDIICQICTDMVTQARDQLQSNETQEELKEVFEGSCKLIPIKIVQKECIKLSDDFVPELVETLASQMNPQAVCSVAGLCNNAKIDIMLEGYTAAYIKRTGCSQCLSTVHVARKKFDATSYDDFLIALLRMCGNMDSLSDSCSMLVFKYYENILEAVKKDLTPRSVCHVSGQCSETFFHSHSQYNFADENMTLYTVYDNDVPCEFCEQLVKHLSDTLIANTTEIEFQKILIGLCKQTGSFKSECLSLVEQYNAVIYNYLVSEMKPDELCGYIGICKKLPSVPIAPLVQDKKLGSRNYLIGAGVPGESKQLPKVTEVMSTERTTVQNVQIVGTEPQQLPVERMFIAAPTSPASPAVCSFCQYFLHYLQVELSDERTEEAIRKTVENACDVLPASINDECRQFVTQYGPAVIALLVQEIDPSSVCPALGLCPQVGEVRHVAINSEKSNCPLCLFAVEQLETMLKNNRSEENIRHALDNLCNHLSAKLRTECVDFVDTYTSQLVEMLVANMNAQEICVYLKLCKDNIADPLKITRLSKAEENNVHSLKTVMDMSRGDIETNEIPDHTVNGRPVKTKQKTVCIICEFIMKEIDDQIRDKHNDDEIKKVVRGVCRSMPKSVRDECDQFMDKYADLVISLLAQELDPNEVCQELKLCVPSNIQAVKEEILDCAVCETVVMAVKKVLSNDKVDRNIVHIVEKSCNMLPAKYYERCHTLMEIYGEGIIHLIEDYGTKGVCQKIGLCGDKRPVRVNLYKEAHGKN